MRLDRTCQTKSQLILLACADKASVANLGAFAHALLTTCRRRLEKALCRGRNLGTFAARKRNADTPPFRDSAWLRIRSCAVSIRAYTRPSWRRFCELA